MKRQFDVHAEDELALYQLRLHPPESSVLINLRCYGGAIDASLSVTDFSGG